MVKLGLVKRECVATSYHITVRCTPEGHLFGYQGQQKAGNNSKWYAFQLRMYNPSLGRWNSTDPYYQHDSPYLAMANNPVSFVDSDGGRAVMTEYMKKKILNHLFDTKSNITRIEWLRIWMGATGMNHYRGITFEGFYAAIATGTARGINAAETLSRGSSNNSGGSGFIEGDISAALNDYLGPLGSGFLDAPFSSNVSVEEISLAEQYEAKGAADLANLLGTDIFAEIDTEINFLKNVKANREERRRKKEENQNKNDFTPDKGGPALACVVCIDSDGGGGVNQNGVKLGDVVNGKIVTGFDSKGNPLRDLEPGEGLNTGTPDFIGGPLKKGVKAIKLGKYLLNPNAWHTVKLTFLKDVGFKKFAHIVGTNPDISFKGTKIILTGTERGFKGKNYETSFSIIEFITKYF